MGYGGPATAKIPKVSWGPTGLAGLSAAMPWLAQLVGGGSRSGQVGGSIGGTVGGLLGSSSMMGSWAGLGGITGLLGAAAPFLGPVMGLLGGLVGKLFGPSKGAIAGKEADQRIAGTQAQLLQQYGSVGAIAGMGSAGAELAAAWGSKNVAGEAHFTAKLEAFQKQNDLLAQQKDLEAQITDLETQRVALVESLTPQYQDMVSAAQVLGISLDGLGPKVDQLAANESWDQTINALDTLARGGADVGGMLDRSAQKLSAMVQESKKLGTTIPENMRPYLQNLVDSGKLLDASGQKMQDLTGIKFGAAIQTESDKTEASIAAIDKLLESLKTAVQAIVDALAQKLPQAAGDGLRGINDVINRTPIDAIKIPVEVDSPDIPGMAAGGIVTRPTLT
jgi:hypothetical protein